MRTDALKILSVAAVLCAGAAQAAAQAPQEPRRQAAATAAPELQDTLTAARVSADRLRTAMRTQTGLVRLDSKELNRGFAVFSTPDLIKTLQLLPGVASGTELMSGLFVHGGTGGDNLFLLDGSSIYNTSHLIGLFSAFNTDVVDGVDFY